MILCPSCRHYAPAPVSIRVKAMGRCGVTAALVNAGRPRVCEWFAAKVEK